MSLKSASPALAAALMFGASTPAAKVLVGDVSPVLLAGLLYLGSGLGLAAVLLARRSLPSGSRASATLQIPRAEWPWLAGAVTVGGLLGPVLLMLGLVRTEAAAASLLLNVEGVLTALIAWLVFKENADRRVVLVRNAERYNTESAAGPLIEYLKSPCPSTILLLIAGQIDKRTKFYKSCEKAGTVIECPQLSEQEVSQWVRTEMTAREKSIEPVAVQEIVRRAGTHLSDVNNAIGIVIAYAGDASTIRESDVVAACADVAEEEVWSLTDAIAASQSAVALTSLRKLIDLGKQEDEILGIINWLLKSAYALALGGPSANSISRFVANKVRPLSDKLGLQKLRDAFALCTDAHFMIRSTGVDGALALELLVVKLAAPRGQGANTQATRT